MDPNSGQGGDPAPVAWHGNDYGALVTGKGWKSADDALKSYSELEKHIGLPPDRLVRLPEAGKVDDAFRSDLFKRIGYEPPALPRAPEKIEDYGVAPREGAPAEYTNAMLAAAHKAGLTKEQLAAIVQANDSFVDQHGKTSKEAEDKLVGDRIKAADGKLAERFKDKLKEGQDGITREAARLGYTPESLKATEEALALIDDNALPQFRTLLADIADARTEAPLHRGATNLNLDSAGAKSRLDQLSADPKWVERALERGTPEAVERLRLNALATGVQMTEETAKALASGTLGAQ